MARRILEDKKKRVNVFLNENERLLLKEKMEKYGFQNLSDYLRAVGIYENIYLIDYQAQLMAYHAQIAPVIMRYLNQEERHPMFKKSLFKDLTFADIH
uniref:hypothetical protein n=1 Tax=Faecalibaculum rodentium TaxID=1702221 RepID=UPI003F600D53